MKVSSLPGAATATRNAMLQMLTQTSAGATTSTNAATTAGGTSPLARPAAMAPPPPRSSSFGGADPRAMFEALVQKFDNDGDGKLSLGEVNALNQGGLLSRSFGRIDANRDGTVSSDEVAGLAPWSTSMPTTGDQGGGQQGADVRPLFDKLTDHLNSNRDAALIAQDLAAIRRAEFGKGADATGTLTATQTPASLAAATMGMLRPAEPATMMESMVLALSAEGTDEAERLRQPTAPGAATLR